MSLLRRIFEKHSEVSSNLAISIIQTLRRILLLPEKKDFEMDAMEILRIISFSFISLLQGEIDDFLFGEIWKHYNLENQDMEFSSICILGNLAGQLITNSKTLRLIDQDFMES